MAVESVRGVFWNVGGLDRRELIADLAIERRLNVIVVAESPFASDKIVETLNERPGLAFSHPETVTERLQVFSGQNEFDLREVYADDHRRLTIRRLHWNGREFLLVAVHCVSKSQWDEADQRAEAQVLANQIRDWEAKAGHRRTMLVGDLNMNPFERGVVEAAGLHGMMVKADVMEGTRQIQTRHYPFFYNPMWGLFGDRTPGPPGTYFYRVAAHLSYDWNIFDQF